MAQEAVRRDELADHLTTFKSVVATSTTGNVGASWVVPLPFPARPIERIQCSLWVQINEEEAKLDDVQYYAPTSTVLHCLETGEAVGIAATGLVSYVYAAGPAYSRIADSPCVTESMTTWLRQPTVLRQLTLTLHSSSGQPFELLPPALTGTMNMQIIARFTFFGPRDTRLF